MDRDPTTGVTGHPPPVACMVDCGCSLLAASNHHQAHPFWGSFIIFYLSDVLHYASDIYYMYKALTWCAAMHNLQVLKAITISCTWRMLLHSVALGLTLCVSVL